MGNHEHQTRIFLCVFSFLSGYMEYIIKYKFSDEQILSEHFSLNVFVPYEAWAFDYTVTVYMYCN